MNATYRSEGFNVIRANKISTKDGEVWANPIMGSVIITFEFTPADNDEEKPNDNDFRVAFNAAVNAFKNALPLDFHKPKY
ncbi:MAG: hypothetical protein Q8L47_02900 [bacterium]|nr:hypothetical protein [bacterium]